MIETQVSLLQQKYQTTYLIDCNGIYDFDLIKKIKLYYKEAYQPNERLIFFWNKSYKNFVNNLELILNSIDISRNFVIVVTSDKEVINTYKPLIPDDQIEINIVDDDFVEIQRQSPLLTKDDIFQIDTDVNLTNTQKHLLFENKSFCMAPWVHTFVSTTGNVGLCCSARYKDTKMSITDFLNSDRVLDIKDNMINGNKIEECQHCYNEEKLNRKSYRHTFNQKYLKYINQIYTNDINLKSWDFRFNNLCNLSCRSCGFDSSSSWAKPNEYLGIKVKNRKNEIEKVVFEELKQHINNVEEIYFAGGEPLLMSEHYELLDLLISNNRTDVKLVYNTNFTKTTYKKTSVFDLWNKFDSVAVCASLDASDKRAEYLRCGTVWSTILKNRKEMKEKCPQIYFWVSATTGVINALHIPDFHKELHETNFIEKLDDFNVQNIYWPDFMRVDNITDKLKKQIINKYKEHIKWLEQKDHSKRSSSGFQGIINLLDKNTKFDHKLFWSNVTPLDNYYNKNLLDYFPELEDLKNKE